MLYAFSVMGNMLLFSGNISPQEYDLVEKIATDIFNQNQKQCIKQYSNELSKALISAGINVTAEKIQRVFRPKKQ